MLSVPRWLAPILFGVAISLLFPNLLNPNPALASGHTRSASSTLCPSTRCAKEMLAILNSDRAEHNLAPLRLNRVQTFGVAGWCPGSLGHSRAMARTGEIWHSNPSFPRASFPRNICGSHADAGQNVGNASGTSVVSALDELNNLMMAEPHSRSLCASSRFNHACNILDPSFHKVGIGVYLANGSVWLTEDFTS